MATIDKIDNLDKKILKILSQNARIPFKDVATECNVSRAAIHQRVQHLIEANVIMGSGFDVNPKSLGYSTCTYVGMWASPSSVVPCTRMWWSVCSIFPRLWSATSRRVLTL